MGSKNRRRTSSLRSIGAATLTLSLLAVLVLLLVGVQSAQGQAYRVIYNFTGGQDGAHPYAGLSMDPAGNLYGTTSSGGNCCGGTVFRLAPSRSGWVFTRLHAFGVDHGGPFARVIIGPDGSLYGTTYASWGGGTVFNLRPPKTPCTTAFCPWTETVLHAFNGGPEGAAPFAPVIFDRVGNLYGTTTKGGTGGGGVVYKLTPTATGWRKTILHNFTGGADGWYPMGEVIFDDAGNLYGTTAYGGQDSMCCGTVFQMTPSGSGWTKKVIYNFQGTDGAEPEAGLVLDHLGNLFGTTLYGGSRGGGTVFELTSSNGSWTEIELYSFPGWGSPEATLTLDGFGNLYGSSIYGNNGLGNIFKLTPSNGNWTFTSLHDFTGGSDGSFPHSSILIDAAGNLYGTGYWNGAYDYGVVFEITP